MEIKAVFLSLLMLSSTAFGETYLCPPDATAGVAPNDSVDGKFKAGIYDLEEQFVLTNDGGPWHVNQLTKMGSNLLFDKCLSKHFCESSKGYMGTFIMDSKNQFTVYSNQVRVGIVISYVSRGRCTKL